MIKYQSIDQYRHFIKNTIASIRYTHTDEEGHAQFDKNIVLPTIPIYGTVKLHGTNAAITYDGVDRLRFQSRNNVITPENDNAGFATYMSDYTKELEFYCKSLMYGTNAQAIRIYGEWCGGNIQASVGINGLPKMFVVFDIYLFLNNAWIRFNVDDHIKNVQLVNFTKLNIHSVYKFPIYRLAVDLANPMTITEAMESLTLQVEENCPVAAKIRENLKIILSPCKTGEGIVWSTFDKSESFKVKGNKHSSSKVKKLVTISPEVLKNIGEFVDYACTENRLQQGYTELFGEWESVPDMCHISLFIKWMMKDIGKEETDVLVESNLTMKQVQSQILNKIRNFYTNKINNII